MGKAVMSKKRPRVKKDSQILNRNKMRKGGNGENGNNGNKRKARTVIGLHLNKEAKVVTEYKDIEVDLSFHNITERKGKKEIAIERTRTHSKPGNVGDAIDLVLKSLRFSEEERKTIIYNLLNQLEDLTKKLSYSKRRKTQQMFLLIEGTRISILEKIKQGRYSITNSI